MTRKNIRTFYLVYQCATPFYTELIGVFADKKKAIEYARKKDTRKDLTIKVTLFRMHKYGYTSIGTGYISF